MSSLPKGWASVQFEDIADVQLGKMLDKLKNKGQPTPYLRNVNVRWGAFELGDILEMRMSDVERQAFNILDGDLLVCEGGEPGRAAVWCGGATALTFQKALMRVRSTGAVEPNYLAAYLRSAALAGDLEPHFTGTTIKHLPQNVLRSLELPLPPLAEQWRIVAKLDALTVRTARARADLDRVPDLAAHYKEAVLELALSGKLTDDWRKARGIQDEDIQEATVTTPFIYTLRAPSSWVSMPLLEACEIIGGSQPPKSTFSYVPDEGLVRLIQIRDYKSDAHVVFIPKALARRFCDETDVMIGRYGPPVFQILRGLQGAYNVALMKAAPRDGFVSKDYLFWLLSHPTLRRYVELDAKRTAGQDGVNKAHLERFPVFLPSAEEQVEIVSRIEKSFAEIDRLVAEAAAARRLLDRLDQAILAKAFRGELAPQDPADEPASVLLERIRAGRAAAPAKPGRGRRTKAAA